MFYTMDYNIHPAVHKFVELPTSCIINFHPLQPTYLDDCINEMF